MIPARRITDNKMRIMERELIISLDYFKPSTFCPLSKTKCISSRSCE
jgi:hypothetical protein